MATINQRLILLYDGTWNDAGTQTNVFKLSRSIHDYDGAMRQRFFYDPGVGTARFTKFRGGVTGLGLSKNLLEGYDWLVRRYIPGDSIFVFGFSRGAYTARSLVGMIRKCGLLHISTPDLLEAAEALYRNKDAKPDGEACVRFRADFSRDVEIEMIGVWDTVGALGIPGTMLSERGKYSWHDTELSKIVKRAYQAIALDEHRAAYDAVLWTSDDGVKKPEQVDVEQRWFIGAHANVGGGYGKDPLSEISLAWMQQKAMQAGLKLTLSGVSPNAHATGPKDSYRDFLSGAYAFYQRLAKKGDGRHYRQYKVVGMGKIGVGITIDDSVWMRWNGGFDYRPPTLVSAGLTPP